MKKILVIADKSTYKTLPRGIQGNRLINELSNYYEITLITSKNSIPDDKHYFKNDLKLIYTFKNRSKLKTKILGSIWNFWRVKDKTWFKHAKNCAFEEVKKNKFDVVISLSMDLANAEIGFYLKHKFKSIKWISFFSDPISLNHYIAKNYLTRIFLKYYEKKIFNKSDKIVFPSETMRNQYQDIYPNWKSRFLTIPHFYINKDKEIDKSTEFDESKFIIRHYGNLNIRRSPIPIIAFIKSHEEFFKKNQIKFEFIGRISNKLTKQLKKEKCAFIEFKSSVHYNELYKSILNTDLLLVIDANYKNSPYFPSKIVEYFKYNIPILGITTMGSETERVLKDVGYFSVRYGEMKEIIQAIEKLRNKEVLKNIKLKYEKETVLIQWLDLIEKTSTLLIVTKTNNIHYTY